MSDVDPRAEAAGQFYDSITLGRGTPERRAAYIKTSLSLRSSGREEPKPRPLGQASLDAQPARKAKERYKRQIHELKLRAASPLRSDDGKSIKPQDDAAHLPLFVTANEPTLF
jgi:hypothetical protein